jgi:hypothetical protein
MRDMTDKMPESIDLSDKCGPVQDQGTLGSSTSCAAVALFEFNEKNLSPSRLFIYRHARKLDDG